MASDETTPAAGNAAAADLQHVRALAERRGQELVQLRAQLAERTAALARATAEHDRANAELVALRARLAFVHASRSWRLTAPLRQLAAWLGLARRLERGAAHAARLEALVKANLAVAWPGLALPAVDAKPAPHLFVDVTELALHAGKAGVQRVAREIARALLEAPPAGYRMALVVATPGAQYRLACAPGGPAATALGAALAPAPGDVFLGLDLALRAVAAHATDFAAWHARGVRFWFVCHDTLPLAHPEWFPAGAAARYRAWLQAVAAVAEGIACVSRATAADVRHWLGAIGAPQRSALAVTDFRLGTTLDADAAVSLTTGDRQALERLPRAPAFLMVGTLEPRKGHAQALAAFEMLWARGRDVTLVLAGAPGWLTAALQERLRGHVEFGVRLFWFVGPDDALLAHLYLRCEALLAASEGEGFGLPLIEAARCGLPILCRDLPVFREVAGEHAVYFSGSEPAALASAIEDWLDLRARGALPPSAALPVLDWAASARQLMERMLAPAAAPQARP